MLASCFEAQDADYGAVDRALAVAALKAWVEVHLDEPVTHEGLSQASGLETRQLIEFLGDGDELERAADAVRAGVARNLILFGRETPNLPSVAKHCGFTSVIRLNRALNETFGVQGMELLRQRRMTRRRGIGSDHRLRDWVMTTREALANNQGQ